MSSATLVGVKTTSATVSQDTWYNLSDFMSFYTYSYAIDPKFASYPSDGTVYAASAIFIDPSADLKGGWANSTVEFQESNYQGDGPRYVYFDVPGYASAGNYSPYVTDFSSIKVKFLKAGTTSIGQLLNGIATTFSLREYVQFPTSIPSSRAYANYRDPNEISLYAPITVMGPLFTSGADTVNFNNLTPNQIAAIAAGAKLYYSDNGDDVVTLPSATAAANLGGTGIPYLTNQIFSTGTGNHTIKGGDLGYKVALLGAGNNQVTLGDGTNGVSAPFSGNNTVTLGTGNNTVTLGTGTDTVYVTPGTSSEVDTITVGDGQNLVYGGTGTTTITAGTGSNILIGNSAQTTFVGSGGHDQYLVQDGNTIKGFVSGGIIDIIAVDPVESINSVVVRTDNSQTFIDAYDQTLSKRVAHITLDGVFQTTNFFGTRTTQATPLSGSKDYVQLTYSGRNPTTVFEGIETGVFDAASVIDHARDLAKSAAQGLIKDKIRDELLTELQHVTVKFPLPVLNLSKFVYDFASATTSFAFGDLTAQQYEVEVAKSLINFDPTGVGSKLATVGSYIVSKWIDAYFAALDRDILPPEPKTAVVPIKETVAALAPSLSAGNAAALSAALSAGAGTGGTVAQTT